MTKIISIELILAISILIIFILLLILGIYILIINKIHDSYHKGYNECRNDEILYYKVLRDLDNSFIEIIKLIDNEGLSFSFKTTQSVIEYNKLLKKYRQKY